MLPTPSTRHVDFNKVYEPAEDSFLLIDTLSSNSEAAFLSHHFSRSTEAPVIVEVGTGSGVVLAFVTAWTRTILGRNDVLSLGIDVNEYACKATAETVRTACRDSKGNTHALFGDTILSDLTACLRPGTIDILIFNPPYVPTEDLPAPQAPSSITSTFEHDSHLLALSYAGGVDGMETTNRLLAQIPDVLSERGVAYVLLCAQNKPEEVKVRIRMWDGGWRVETIGESGMKGGWEKLQIVRIWRDR